MIAYSLSKHLRARAGRRNHCVAERMRQRAEGRADVDAVIQRGRRLAVIVRRERDVVLHVRQPVQHRCVLREQQRDDEQQAAEWPAHISVSTV